MRKHNCNGQYRCATVLLLIIYISATNCANSKNQLSGDSKHYFHGQLIDHFAAINPTENTFKQKFYINDDFFDVHNKSSPVFLYINGEAPCSGTPNNYLREYAKRFSARIIVLEHRYYGESQPFSTLETHNLRYLSSKQAIEDIAYFIQYANKHVLKEKRKWLTFGCSYAGALSAWFRLKHPDLTHGSLSSSGVVHAILDFTAFDKQISESAGEKCAARMRETTHAIEQAMARDREGTLKMFNATFFEDDGDFYYMLADSGAETVQYGFQDQVCNTVLNANPDNLVEAYANWTVNWWYPYFNGGPPVGYATAYLQLTTPATPDRSWWFQKCSELAFFQNAPAVNSIRSHNINMTYHLEHCRKVFGVKLFPSVDATNDYYGGANIRGTQIYFANSSQDPWQRASVVHSPDPKEEPARLIVCHDCGHCSDLRGCPSLASNHNLTGCSNMQPVNQTRSEILSYITAWLA